MKRKFPFFNVLRSLVKYVRAGVDWNLTCIPTGGQRKQVYFVLFTIRKSSRYQPTFRKINNTFTFPVWVLRLLSVAKPLPQMLQWKGRFLRRSIWLSWLRRCCWRLDSWMNARPHSGMWHLYGLSPATTRDQWDVRENLINSDCQLSVM